MIHDQVRLHNVAQLVPVPGQDGLRLQRVPEHVRLCLNEKSQEKMLMPVGAEIRFRSDGDKVAVTLRCPVGSCEVIPFWGPFQGPRTNVAAGTKTLELEYPARLRDLPEQASSRMAFSPRVWRLVLRGAPVHFVGIEGQGIRPPEPSELPDLRMIAYGTSITQGSAATANHLTYVHQAARLLGADIRNLGSSGSAYCEPEIADYIASCDDWDAGVLCVSVNMVGAGFTLEEYAERTSYMIRTLADSNGKRELFCITPFPHYRDFNPAFSGDGTVAKGTLEQFRQTLRDVVSTLGRSNVHILEGPELLTRVEGLSIDMIHPSDPGMAEIGYRLAARISAKLSIPMEGYADEHRA
ncbi:hypothetical protein FE783_08700 [Paenibacillus mesophilus]|uniref:SGNH/GDSL hydrolase family protein n=1 Tax=Paenibacillus mesophilus TaxID=2582849 RepID=UPI00110D5472|nr:SGNH/GDSL hydrolase family protein [Paenibacillus mesophilus]TMV50754.1 hypothetical protein FE783_08700 [Paenibacillus mesophilus]